MVQELAVGFVLLVVGSYLGTTLALRGFFGREYFDPRTGEWTGEAERMSEAGHDRSGRLTAVRVRGRHSQ